jgi:hypothetical protein
MQKHDFPNGLLGEGSFVRSNVTPDLVLAPDGPKHGVVEPARAMLIQEYQDALAATRSGWQMLAEPDGS